MSLFTYREKVVESRTDKIDRWEHDLYVEEEQAPRLQWEIDRVCANDFAGSKNMGLFVKWSNPPSPSIVYTSYFCHCLYMLKSLPCTCRLVQLTSPHCGKMVKNYACSTFTLLSM